MTNEEMIYYLQRMPSVFGIYGDYDLEIINQIVNEIKRKDKEIQNSNLTKSSCK